MRLNKEIRQKIVDNAYKASTIPAAKKALTQRSVELSEAVRLDAIGGKDVDDSLRAAEKEIKLILKKRGIPEEFQLNQIFERKDYSYVELGGESCYLRLNGRVTKNREWIVSGDSTRDYYSFSNNSIKKYPADHVFTLEYTQIVAEAEKLRDDEAILRGQVAGAANSFNTTEKLLESWPEAAALIPKEVAKASQPMPIAIQVKELNALIGLPKE